ncbi:MAG TPA: radical SAM protein [bacterium]|nr:radical SAM protein [bacterium]
MTVVSPTFLSQRLGQFSASSLSVPWRSGSPYDFASHTEIDTGRTILMAQGGERVRVNNVALSEAGLKTADVAFCSVPSDDFERRIVVDGVAYDELLGDVMGSMTDKANPPGRRLHSHSPDYAAEFLRASLNAGAERVRFLSPRTTEDFRTAMQDSVPDLLLLSGLNVNIPRLLDMALIAREMGVKEVWLGGDAALGPYAILDQMFDRVIWGPGEEYLYRHLVGDRSQTHRHPPADRMLAEVRWLIRAEDGTVVSKSFQTLHLALRLGCTQSCDYCAEGVKSESGKARPPTSFEEAKRIIDDAYDLGIRRVYFVDPDFGRLWKSNDENALERRVVAYLADKGMRWSCLTNVVAMRRHGSFMMDHGLASIYLGIESLAPSHRGTGGKGKNVLKVLDRSWQDQDDTVDLVPRLTEQGVLVFGLYILYNPGETEEDVWRGVESLKNLVSLSQISTNQPFPGTEEFKNAVREGLIFNLHPHAIRYGQMVWAPGGNVTDPDTVSRTYIQAHREVNDLMRPGGFFDRQEKHRPPK